MFNLNDLISDIVEDYNNQFQENENIKLEIDVLFDKSIEGIYGKSERFIEKEANPIYVLADRTRITQVLSNLINNAIKFTSVEGIITIIVEEKYEEGKVYVTVKDYWQWYRPIHNTKSVFKIYY